jgi:N6-adenosine-specific RNA methylase IME4
MQIVVDPEFKALIPSLAPEEYAQLEANVRADGCRDPLVLWAGHNVLVDGHHRFAICTRHSLPFETTEIEFATREAVSDWIDANQLGRRNLTPDQRSIIRGRRYNRTKQDGFKGNQHTVGSGQNVHQQTTAETLAAQHHVTERTIRRDGKRAEFVERLAITNPEAAKAVVDGMKKINEVKRVVRLEEVKEAAKLPDAKYRIVYADPPWKYGDQLTEDYGPARFHYPSMSIGELCSLPVVELCEKDAVLFLWVTSPLLFECQPIIQAWGFAYKASFVWDKIKHNMGHYNSVRHEFLLICTRGSCQPDVLELVDSVQSIERTQHSAKPEEFRVIIDRLYPHGRRIELFARQEADGWERWGNQA